MGAAAVAHFSGELIAMGILMAIDATPRSKVQVVAGPLALMTARAADQLMFTVQRKLRATVLLNGEQCRPEPVLVVTARAIGRAKAASVDVTMTVGALLEPQAPISPLRRKLGRVTTLTRDVPMQTLEGKCGLRVRSQPDFSWQPGPSDSGVAVLASITELRFVHRRMAGNALRARAWRCHVALVVTGHALGLGVAPGQAQARMIFPDIGYSAPIGLIVTRDALGPCERALMRILMAGSALGL